MSPVVALYHLFLFSALPSLIPFLSLVLSFRAINPAKPLTPPLPLSRPKSQVFICISPAAPSPSPWNKKGIVEKVVSLTSQCVLKVSSLPLPPSEADATTTGDGSNFEIHTPSFSFSFSLSSRLSYLRSCRPRGQSVNETETEQREGGRRGGRPLPNERNIFRGSISLCVKNWDEGMRRESGRSGHGR